MCASSCFKLGRSVTETLEMKERPFREETTKTNQASDWYSTFKIGLMSAKDAECLGHLSISKI